ncbi:MAG TPA: hypothetical protein VIR03_01050 [Candidatus Saccharimonadales bacterium]
MSRLPTPGKDNGTWGAILNDYLSQAHNGDGSLKSGIIGAGHILDGSIPTSKFDAATQTTLSGKLNSADLDSQIAANIGNNLSATNAALATRDMLNILDYGVVRGTSSSQTAAIKAALDAHPGMTFYFPPGSYRLDTSLTISQANSLVLAHDARIYAGAPMSILINYTWSGPGYVEDKMIIGGQLDGALNAQTILSIGTVIHFTLAHILFTDGINRGLVTRSGPGAELIAYDCRFLNTTISNVTNNVAIEANMGDSHFRDIIMRDWTVAVVDTNANRWDRVHPWIGPDMGAVTQMTSRYPSSIAFDLSASSDLGTTLSDTYRIAYKFRTNGTSYTAPPRLLNARAMWALTLPNALATANPAYVLDNSDGIGAIIDRLTMAGHSVVPGSFLLGATTNLYARNTFSYGFINGVADVANGVVQGSSAWTPTLFGSTTAGTPTYITQSGRMVVDNGRVTYYFSVKATLDNNVAGNLRVGGLSLPSGATGVRNGGGAVGFSTAGALTGAMIFAGTTDIRLYNAAAGNSAELVSTTLRGTTVEIHGFVSTTYLP